MHCEHTAKGEACGLHSSRAAFSSSEQSKGFQGSMPAICAHPPARAKYTAAAAVRRAQSNAADLHRFAASMAFEPTIEASALASTPPRRSPKRVMEPTANAMSSKAMAAKAQKKPNPKQAREELLQKVREQKAAPPDPLSAASLRTMAIRLGIVLLVAWGIAFAISGWISKVVAGVLTLAVAGLAYWAFTNARKSVAVANLVRTADSAEARKEAISKLETDFKKDDTAAVFAKAQLQLQEDPRAALRTLETIKLDKLMAPAADETRAQRAMIHLMLGETDEARGLADKIDLGQHKEAKTRAMMTAIVGEALARTGSAKRAVELLEKIDPDDKEYADLKMQLLRARAFAFAWTNNMKAMKHTLRGLYGVNPQLLAGFITKKKNPMGVSPRGVHPALEKEAFDMLMRSGAVPRKMEFRRG